MASPTPQHRHPTIVPGCVGRPSPGNRANARRIFAKPIVRVGAMALLLGAIVALPGCSMLVTVLRAAKGNMVPAEYDELSGKRVAIVTVTDSSQYRDDIAAKLLARRLSAKFKINIDNIDVVREDEVEQWRDTNKRDDLDFVEIGRGVNADEVVSVQLRGLRLKDGATLYRGRCDVTMSVMDVKTGKLKYQNTIPGYSYPKMAGQYTSETTENTFRRVFLSHLAERIGQHFYPFEFADR
ncbi:MAG: hypothetical protein AAFP69_15540, partial [Planctomycetota bacterium]